MRNNRKLRGSISITVDNTTYASKKHFLYSKLEEIKLYILKEGYSVKGLSNYLYNKYKVNISNSRISSILTAEFPRSVYDRSCFKKLPVPFYLEDSIFNFLENIIEPYHNRELLLDNFLKEQGISLVISDINYFYRQLKKNKGAL